MKSFLISDSRDTWVGMKLAGINGVLVRTKEEAQDALKAALENDETGILIMTEHVVDMLGDEVLRLKLKSQTPILVEVPDRHGTTRTSDAITSYIRDSVGIKI